MRRILGALFVASSITAVACAQSIGGNASISATGTSSSVQLPANTPSYPAVIIAPATGVTTEIFYALGNSSVAAIATPGATQSPSLPPNGICVNVGPNTYVAAITGGTAASVRITQLSTCPPF
jgi:hypothetical protein